MNALDRMLAERNAALLELATLKGQEPVMQHCPNCNHEQTALSVDCGNCGNVYDAAPIQAGAQPAQQEPEGWTYRKYNAEIDVISEHFTTDKSEAFDNDKFSEPVFRAAGAQPAPESWQRMLDVLREVHGWLVCSPIASNDDMAQSFEYMENLVGKAVLAAPVQAQEQRKPPVDEFGWRGILAANLHCWHRLTESESDELVSFFGELKEPRKPLSYEQIVWATESISLDSGCFLRIARAIEQAHGIKEQG